MLVVADAGPLIYLSAAGHLELLPQLYDRILVPSVVFEEVVDRGAGLPGSAELAAATWVEVPPSDVEDPVCSALLATLDHGEAAALALARREGADLVLIDERRGREVARRLGLPVRGTLGVLVQARRQGAIDALAPILEQLIDAGFWISDELVSRVLGAVGEAPPEAGN